MRKKILIIDDNIIYRKIIQGLLCDDYQLTFAENLSETMGIIKDGINPDLVISDFLIKPINRYELRLKILEYV